MVYFNLNIMHEHEDRVLHVFDLPQLYTRPSVQTLLETLDLLTLEPPTWMADDDTQIDAGSGVALQAHTYPRRPQVDSEGLAGYLTKIVGSNLGWIESEEDKEKIWEEASQRLAERAGRTARGALTRKFKIATSGNASSANSSASNSGFATPTSTNSTPSSSSICISLHEPALTADNLGLKTWAASYLLANRLRLLSPYLPRLPPAPHESILELGSGTGLVGIAAASVLGAGVVLTDLPEITANLSRNISMNQTTISHCGGSGRAAILDWSDPRDSSTIHAMDPDEQAERTTPPAFPLILAADPLYSSEHPRLLVQAIQACLAQQQDARVVIELPLRDGYDKEVSDFQQRMHELGMQIAAEGEETGYDDWGDGRQEVKCWWSVWRWAETR